MSDQQTLVTDVVIREATAPGDLGWMIMAHGELYAREYGWDASFEALVARIMADYANSADPGRARAWIAEVDGRRAGCVMCCPEDDTTAELHTLLVEPWARGRRLGAMLVDRCLEFARTTGFARMRLWTNDPLVAARRIYLSRGFTLVSQQPHRSFGADLIGQYYELDLQ
ncbi:MAG TPA: GNAT family N-acetyltransferase [Streptosporangiaceae bacterium]|nr:GNAT family N-acetyltransferase [Streptosporangiaceae bacterium]